MHSLQSLGYWGQTAAKKKGPWQLWAAQYNLCGWLERIGIKLLTRLRLGFSHLSEHIFRHNFADSLNPLFSCSLETESTLHFFLRYQNYTTLRRALMTDLKNINDAIMSLNESDLLHVMLYGSKKFESNMDISILTATIKFIEDTGRFDQPLF